MKAVQSGMVHPDGILIATPPNKHLKYIRWGVERGIPVFVEKPMVLQEEIPELVSLYETHPDLIFSIEHALERAAVLKALQYATPEFLGQIEEVRGKLLEMQANQGWVLDPAISGGGQAMDTMV